MPWRSYKSLTGTREVPAGMGAGALCRLRAEARPELLDHPVRLLVPTVVGEPHSVVHVDVRHAPDEQLQLVLVEHAQHVLEPFHERAELLRDTPGDPVYHDEIDVPHFIHLRHLRHLTSSAARPGLDNHTLAEVVLCHGERLA